MEKEQPQEKEALKKSEKREEEIKAKEGGSEGKTPAKLRKRLGLKEAGRRLSLSQVFAKKETIVPAPAVNPFVNSTLQLSFYEYLKVNVLY